MKIKKNRGQVTVEYLLLAVVLIALFKLTTDTLRNSGNLKEFEDEPRRVLRGVIENGNWKHNFDEREYHPNHYNTHYTPDGKGCSKAAPTTCLQTEP